MVILPSTAAGLAIGELRLLPGILQKNSASHTEPAATGTSPPRPKNPQNDLRIEMERIAAENAARLATNLINSLMNSLVENARQNALTGVKSSAATAFSAVQGLAAYRAIVGIPTSGAISELLLADRLALASIRNQTNDGFLTPEPPAFPASLSGINIFV